MLKIYQKPRFSDAAEIINGGLVHSATVAYIGFAPIHIARKNKQLQEKIADLFEYRHLFVKHILSEKEKKTLRRITQGFNQLRNLQSIMDEVYMVDQKKTINTLYWSRSGERRKAG